MSTLKRSILFAVLCFALTFITNAQLVKVARDSYYEASYESNLFVDRKTFSLGKNKGNVTFVTCPKGYHHKLEKNCTVALDTQPGRSCPVTLKTINKSLYFTEYLEVFPFGSAKAVIVWGEFNQTRPGPNHHSAKILIRCTVVDVNTCKNRQLVLQSTLNYSTYLSQVLQAKYAVYDDSFEIIIENAENSKYLNKYKIDGEGNIVFKSVPWIAKPASKVFLPIVADSKLIKSYLHNDNGPEGESRLYMLNVDSDGSEKLLLKFHQDLIYQDISTAHNTIGIARGGDFFNVETNSSNSRVDIVQFDLDGKLKLNTTFNTWIHIQYLELHNLPTGGFILVIGGCEDEANCDRVEFGIQKFIGDGTVIGSSKFPGADSCKGHLTLQVFENEPKEYCVAYLCSNARRFKDLSIIQGKQFINLLINCFTDNS